MTSAKIVPASEAPLRDEERAHIDVDALRAQARLLDGRFVDMERNGQSRSLENLDSKWMKDNIPELESQYPSLVSMMAKNSRAIDIANHMFYLIQLRQEGKITGFQQDAEFARLVAKSYIPSEFHNDIDQKIDGGAAGNGNNQ